MMNIDPHCGQPSGLAGNLRLLLLVVGFTVVTSTIVAPVVAQAAASGKANANQLAQSADRAVGYLVKVARSSKDPKLKPSATAAKPFWASVSQLNQSVDKLGRGLYLRDQTFFHGLGDAISAVTATSVALAQSGAHDRKVTDALARVERIVGLLDQKYGKVAARKAKGGGLSAQEKRKLAALRNKQVELQRRLKEVEKKASGNRQAIRGIERIRHQSDRIYYARNTLADFLAALVAIRVVDGLLWGWSPWWGPWGGWVENYSFGYMDGYYDAIDVIDYDWAVTDVEIDVADYDLDVAIDDADMVDADSYLDNSGLDLSTEDLGELAGEGLGDDLVPGDSGATIEDIADIDGGAEALPATTELEFPDTFDPIDSSAEMDAIDPTPTDFDTGGRFDQGPPADYGAGGGLDGIPSLGTDDGFDGGAEGGGGFDGGGFDGGGFDGGGFDGGGFDGGGGGFDGGMDMGGGDVDF